MGCQPCRCAPVEVDDRPEFPAPSTSTAFCTNTYLELPAGIGATNQGATAPDAPTLDIVGDFDLRACVLMDDWTPVADFGFAAVIGKWDTGSYGLFVKSTGVLGAVWLDSGGTQRSADSTAATGFVDGTAHWIRVTLDVDNGASGRTVTFFTSNQPIDTSPAAVTWSTLGAAVVQAGVTTVRATSDPLFIGQIGTVEEWAGNFYYGEIRNGVGGTIVASPDFRHRPPGQTQYADGQGNVWAVRANSEVSCRTATGTGSPPA
jgi:hypothetical protein